MVELNRLDNKILKLVDEWYSYFHIINWLVFESIIHSI